MVLFKWGHNSVHTEPCLLPWGESLRLQQEYQGQNIFPHLPHQRQQAIRLPPPSLCEISCILSMSLFLFVP